MPEEKEHSAWAIGVLTKRKKWLDARIERAKAEGVWATHLISERNALRAAICQMTAFPDMRDRIKSQRAALRYHQDRVTQLHQVMKDAGVLIPPAPERPDEEQAEGGA